MIKIWNRLNKWSTKSIHSLLIAADGLLTEIKNYKSAKVQTHQKEQDPNSSYLMHSALFLLCSRNINSKDEDRCFLHGFVAAYHIANEPALYATTRRWGKTKYQPTISTKKYQPTISTKNREKQWLKRNANVSGKNGQI